MAHKNAFILILMGPTASGKSALAIELAQKTGGVIINADAMQMYRDLRIITARPTDAEMAQAPHRLYGVLGATEHGTVAHWLKRVVPEIRAAWEEGKQPILVGGTGMYIRALMDGLADIPEISPDVRQRVKDIQSAPSAGHLHTYLAALDPVMAIRLRPGDTQRIVRALEVVMETGKSLAYWQDEPTSKLLPEAIYRVFAVDRPRQEIYARINARFAEMARNGAMEEVSALTDTLAKGLEPEATHPHRAMRMTPLFKAHGVPEIMACLAGEMTLEEAITKAQTNTRNYAKRQMTWLRNQMPEAVWIESVEEILGHLRR